jgi:PadR family transcriptional regulator PadR
MSVRFLDNWTVQLRKGAVELGLLNALATGPRYGYELARLLGGVEGLLTSQGTLYPLLLRLKKEGLVRVDERPSPAGPNRKYYALTADGRRLLARMNTDWDALVRGQQALRAGATGEGSSR